MVDKDSVTEALSNLKSSTSNLKDKLMEKEDSLDNDEDLQDDIVIDQRSAFGKMKEKAELENPTVVFYPDGTSETK